MTQNTKQNMRTREEQVRDLADRIEGEYYDRYAKEDANSHILEAEARGAAEERAKAAEAIHVVFDGMPGSEMPRFVECENSEGFSVRAGEWEKRSDGLCELVIPRYPANVAALERDLNSWRDRFWAADKERSEYRECMTDCLNLLSRSKTGGLSRIWLKDSLDKHPQYPEED